MEIVIMDSNKDKMSMTFDIDLEASTCPIKFIDDEDELTYSIHERISMGDERVIKFLIASTEKGIRLNKLRLFCKDGSKSCFGTVVADYIKKIEDGTIQFLHVGSRKPASKKISKNMYKNREVDKAWW